MADREQTRRDVQDRVVAAGQQSSYAVAMTVREATVIFGLLEQAERERDERITRDDSDRLLAQRDEARTAYNSLYRKIDDLTAQRDKAQEALRKIIALPVPRAVEAIEIADEALS